MYLLTNARIFTGENIETNKAVLIDGSTIVGLVDASEYSHLQQIDLQGKNLCPGFIDLQIYGGGGSLLNTEPTPETIAKTYRQIRQTGTLHFQITISTTPLSVMLEGIEAARQYQQLGQKGLLGVHLEGPYFNPAKRGAHVEAYVRKPTLTEIQTILDKGKDVVTYMTLAPEMCGEAELKALINSPIQIAAGHSAATYEQATEAFGKGIQRVTHLFNAMSQFQSREVGLVGATYDSDAWASIIADGIHVDYAAIRLSKKMMGKRLFLITDAVTEDTRGEYSFRYQHDRFVDDNGILSGSALSMIEAIHNCVKYVGIPLDEALRMATLYPAQVAEKDSSLGRVSQGYRADLVVFDDDFVVKAIVEQGMLEWF